MYIAIRYEEPKMHCDRSEHHREAMIPMPVERPSETTVSPVRSEPATGTVTGRPDLFLAEEWVATVRTHLEGPGT
jgi:hypothetical protein